VDDHDFLVDGLAARFEIERDMEFVGHAPNADNVVQDVERTGANIVLLDIEMPGADPFESIDDLKRRHPHVKTIMLSAYVRDHYVDQAFDNGAWGYFSKSDSPDDVVDGIRKIMNGEYAFGPSILERVQVARRNGRVELDRSNSKLETLTPRELQILRLIGKGMSRAEIAEALHRSRKTIDVHNTNIMKKLDIHDRVELARFSIREGLVEA
jgi:DNA-binding NarL/FixJ family response regulator